MLTQTLNNIFSKALVLLCLVAGTVSCADALVDERQENQKPVKEQDKGIGQLVLFSVGNVGNTSTSTRAAIPYMEKDGRFVCTMYYHAKAGDTNESKFVVDDETARTTTWLKVFDVHSPDDPQGNSVYWNNQYADLTTEDMEDESYQTYGFDPKATAFYWMNRLDHVFVGFADYNKLKTNTYQTTTNSEGETVPVSRSLFEYPESDGIKRTKTDSRTEWYYKNIIALKFAENLEYSEEDPSKPKYVFDGINENASWAGTGSYHSTLSYETTLLSDIETLVNASNLEDDEKTTLIADLSRTGNTPEVTTVEGTFRYSYWMIYYDKDEYEAAGNTFNLASPKTIIYKLYQYKTIIDIYNDSPANAFDLTRGESMTTIAEQPDPILAVTKMKPAGATQEANRVRLYFEHQLSQIQVNLTNASSSTGDITADRIQSVELLGVSEKAYVFTHVNENGEKIPSSYEPVNLKDTKYDIVANPYGTSFSMFDMGDATETDRYLKSYNAIAFGLLSAIRITWKEADYDDVGDHHEGIVHQATYKIDDADLVNLKSGTRYIYDMELRRGTLAVMRARITGWLLDDDLQFSTEGTINEL